MKNAFWRLRWTFLSLIVILAMFQVYLIQHSPAHPLRQWYHTLQNPTPDTPDIGADFCLSTPSGGSFCTTELRGKYYWVFFGFTFCPDVCPTELAKMANVYEQLPKTAQEQLQLVFITLDPERDTSAVVGEYAQAFHPDLLALTDSAKPSDTVSTTHNVAKSFLVYYAKRPPRDPNYPDDYLLDHSGFSYLMGPDGKYVTHFGSRETSADILSKLKQLIYK